MAQAQCFDLFVQDRPVLALSCDDAACVCFDITHGFDQQVLPLGWIQAARIEDVILPACAMEQLEIGRRVVERFGLDTIESAETVSNRLGDGKNLFQIWQTLIQN